MNRPRRRALASSQGTAEDGSRSCSATRASRRRFSSAVNSSSPQIQPPSISNIFSATRFRCAGKRRGISSTISARLTKELYRLRIALSTEDHRPVGKTGSHPTIDPEKTANHRDTRLATLIGMPPALHGQIAIPSSPFATPSNTPPGIYAPPRNQAQSRSIKPNQGQSSPIKVNQGTFTPRHPSPTPSTLQPNPANDPPLNAHPTWPVRCSSPTPRFHEFGRFLPFMV